MTVLLGVLVAVLVMVGVVVGAAIAAVRVRHLDPATVIDEFTLTDPWRSFVGRAKSASRRMQEAVASAPDGPTKERLGDLDASVVEGLAEVSAVARRGHEIARARHRVSDDQLTARLADATDRTTRDSLAAQLAANERMEAAIADAEVRLERLTTQLDEAVTRATELAASGTDGTSLDGVSNDLGDVVDQMEALRQALDEVESIDGGSEPTGETTLE